MIEIFTQKEFDEASVRDKLRLKCYHCNKVFLKEKRDILRKRRYPNKKGACKFCSRECFRANRSNLLSFSCGTCGKLVTKRASRFKGRKMAFCGQSCAAKYNIIHRKNIKPIRSKIESYNEQILRLMYPKLSFSFNNRVKIKAELDIYIHNLQIAFELNGPSHYKPLFGQEALDGQRERDATKKELCELQSIKLYSINIMRSKFDWIREIIDIINIHVSIEDGARTGLSPVSTPYKEAVLNA